MLEGMVQQGEIGTFTIRNSRSGVWAKDHTYSVRLKRVYSLLYAASKYVEIMHTSSIVESATCLVAMYEYDQKATHETFNRHIKQPTFTPDPRITTLMGMATGLGDKRATALINEFGTPWNIISAGWHNEPVIPSIEGLTIVEGIGMGIVTNLLRGIGRPDV
jgi:ERCC4-type nuclease